MKRSRTLSIAVAMALALTALVGVAQASANYFNNSVSPSKVKGVRVGAKHLLEFGLVAPYFSCENVSFSGEAEVKQNGELTVSPELNGCTHTESLAVWAMHGCKFRFHAGPGPALSGTMDIVGCESAMVYETLSGCRTEIGNQKGLGGVQYTNTTSGGNPAVTVSAKIKSITYTRTKTEVCGEGAAGTFSDGTYQGEWTMTATTTGGLAAGTEVVSTSPPPFTKFVAEEAPVTLAGTNVGENVSTMRRTFGFDEGRTAIGCDSTTYTGSSASASAASIVVTPKFHGCTFTFEGFKTNIPDEYISAGGCSYELSAKGGFNVVGASCATKPLTVTVSGCVYTVGPQTGPASGLIYTNEGSGKLRTVVMSQPAALTALTYTATGPSCYKAGTFSTGTFKGSARFSATNSGGKAQGLSIE